MMVPGPVPWPAVALFFALLFGLPFSCGYCARPYIERVHVNLGLSVEPERR